ACAKRVARVLPPRGPALFFKTTSWRGDEDNRRRVSGAGRRSAAMNRKLIRPAMADQMTSRTVSRVRKPTPPETTNAENFYYLKQMTNKTKMVIVLKDGEQIHGVIEWYDKHALKVHRPTEPNILLLKDNVKYMYKDNEDKDEDRD